MPLPPSCPVTLLPIGLGFFRAKPSPVWILQPFSNLVTVHLLAYEDGTEFSETSAYKIQTPGNYPEGNIQRIINCPTQLHLVGHFHKTSNEAYLAGRMCYVVL